jgi:hypothetical protein
LTALGFEEDPAQEPIAASYSATGVLAQAANKTGRAKADFELREISAAEYDRLKAILQPLVRWASRRFIYRAASKMRDGILRNAKAVYG